MDAWMLSLKYTDSCFTTSMLSVIMYERAVHFDVFNSSNPNISSKAYFTLSKLDLLQVLPCIHDFVIQPIVHHQSINLKGMESCC